MVFHTSMVNWGGTSALCICAFCYMLNLFSVMVFNRSMLDWRRGVNLKVTLAVNLKVTLV